MKICKYLLIVGTLFSSAQLLANEVLIREKPSKIEIEEAEAYWEVFAFGGFAELDADDTIINPIDEEYDKIKQNNSGDWESWTIKVGAGYVLPLFEAKEYSERVQWFTAIEPQVNLYYLEGDVEGQVDRFFEYPGDFNDTGYHFNLKSTRLMFDAALTFASWRNFSVYGLAGLGPSWNRLEYQAKANENVEAINLNAHTEVNFAYEFGAGLRYSVNDRFSVSAEYLYTGFNHLSFGQEGEIENTQEISAASDDFNLHSQAVLFGIHYAL